MDTGDRRVPIAATAWGQMSRSALRTRRRWPFRTDLALLGLIAVQPLEQAVPPDAISPTKVAGAICLITLILDLVVTGRALRFDGADAILSRPPGDRLRLHPGCRFTLGCRRDDGQVGGFVALFVITTQFVDDPRLILKLLWVLSLSAAVAAVLAISNMFGGRSLLAEPTHGDSNDLAYFLATTLPLTAWLIHRSRRFRPLAVACFVTMATGVVFTLSRGAIVGFAVGLVVPGVDGTPRRGRRSRSRSSWWRWCRRVSRRCIERRGRRHSPPRSASPRRTSRRAWSSGTRRRSWRWSTRYSGSGRATSRRRLRRP